MAEKKLKVRLDKLLVDLRLADNDNKARALILAGSIEVDNLPNPKAGSLVDPSSKVKIKESNPYVSRGGLKIESAMKNFNLSPEGRICLDIGASTGGFTDFLLKHGAKKVYALDVGKGLLDSGLLRDPRVVSLEGVNFRYFSSQNLKEKMEFVTIDVSFISLEKILPNAVKTLVFGGEIVAMVKPQFESQPKDLRKGIVKDETARQAAIDRIKAFSTGLGLEVKGAADSGLKGPGGNIEHFLWLKMNKFL